MRPRIARALLVLAVPVPELPAADDGVPTFVDDVAPILYENCIACHQPGGSGPFPLVTYPEVRKRARQIAIVTESGFMPPWMPAPENDDLFVGVRRLEPGEKEVLRAWAEAGAPAGDPERFPAPPELEPGWMLGPPDLLLEMEETYVLPPEGRDVYHALVVPTNLEEGRWIRAFDFHPENRRTVHHLIALYDTTGAARRHDAEHPGVGYPGMTAAEEFFGNEIAGWIPGGTPYMLPEHTAWWLPAGSDVIMDTHMQATGKPEPVKIQMGVYFADGPPEKEMSTLMLGAGPLCIPPGVADYAARQEYEVPVPVEIVAISPHAHYVCRDMKAYVTLPDGQQRELIHIPDWDSSWQGFYRYEEPMRLPVGSRIGMTYVYDNTTDNDRNPWYPPRRVVDGELSSDEMMLLWLHVAVAPEDVDVIRKDVRAQHRRVFDYTAGYGLLFRGIIQAFDRDGDGSLDPEEDEAATAYVNSLPEQRVAIAFDRDGDGVLDVEERAFLEAAVRFWNGEPPDLAAGMPPLPPTVIERE